MECSQNSFEYNAFKSHEEIRLLEIKPDKDLSATLRCQVFHVILPQSLFASERRPDPKYETLSYAWGSALDTTSLMLQKDEGEPEKFFVTKNLESALRCIRHKTEPRTLWVDAICIDQANLTERADQVAVMSRIYRRASQNILWLGLPDDDSDMAFDLLSKHSSAVGIDRSSKAFSSRKRKMPDSQRELDFQKNWDIVATFTERNWQALRTTFSQRPVWSRIWILQEIVSAPEILVLCGQRYFDWYVLGRFVESCMQYSTNYERRIIDDHIIDAIDRVYYIHLYRNSERGHLTSVSSHRSFLPIWRSFCSWTSSDPRDRIYALSALGINRSNVFPEPQPLVKPDYNISPRDLFCAAVRSDIVSTNSLDVLCMGHILEDPILTRAPKEYSLPTWVPDFASSATFANSHIHRYRLDRYKASGSRKPPSMQIRDATDQTSHDTLSLNGIELDTITGLNPTTTRDRRKFEDLQSLIRRLEVVNEHQDRTKRAGPQTVSFAYRHHGFSRGLDGIENWLIAPPKFDQDNKETRCIAPEYDSSLGKDFPATMVCLAGYIFATTTKGLMCMVPERSKAGDTICVLYGSGVPHVLRSVYVRPSIERDECEFHVVGTAYVHDYMHGEAIEQMESGVLAERVFNLV